MDSKTITTEVGGRRFLISKVDAFKQFHIARRLGPILTDLLPRMQKIAAAAKLAKADDKNGFSELVEIGVPVINGLSKLSDEDADYVLHGLLSAVQMEQGPAFVKVYANGVLMIQDLPLNQMLQLAAQAFAHNLGDFFGALPRQ